MRRLHILVAVSFLAGCASTIDIQAHRFESHPMADGKWLDYGVDGIVSDYPNRLREAMAIRGLRLP